MSHNPKAIANFIIKIGRDLDKVPSNLAINKIAYFAHGCYLAKFGEPLIDAKIEAWQFGPVFREIYHEFKRFENRSVTEFAREYDADIDDVVNVGWHLPHDQEKFLEEVITGYLQMSAGYLVRLSHLEDGPWHNAWHHEGRVNPGMEISNDSILDYFSTQVRH